MLVSLLLPLISSSLILERRRETYFRGFKVIRCSPFRLVLSQFELDVPLTLTLILSFFLRGLDSVSCAFPLPLLVTLSQGGLINVEFAPTFQGTSRKTKRRFFFFYRFFFLFSPSTLVGPGLALPFSLT